MENLKKIESFKLNFKVWKMLTWRFLIIFISVVVIFTTALPIPKEIFVGISGIISVVGSTILTLKKLEEEIDENNLHKY